MSDNSFSGLASAGSLEAIFTKIATEAKLDEEREAAREMIYCTPLTAEDRAAKCASCHHLKRYHIETNGILKCKYETCATRCRGFVQYKPKGER